MKKMKFKILLFYKYVPVENPEKLAGNNLSFCKTNEILGRIYIAREGINGTISGTIGNIESYKKFLSAITEFKDITFKEDYADSHAFKKLFVRVREEIVNSGIKNINPQTGGKYLKPEELLELYKSGKEFVIIDARNNYESMIGKFRNAVTPDIKNFREWRDSVSSLSNLKEKTIITYCTGGVRCEKASAYLIQEGFKNVYQLDGGIINFTKKYPDTFWEGGIFVFDERRVLNPNRKEELKHTAKCYFCGKPTSYYINCHNLECDRLIISCHECKIKNNYCCSDECRESDKKRKSIHG